MWFLNFQFAVVALATELAQLAFREDLILEENGLSSGSFLFGKRSARARADRSEARA